MLVVGRWGKEDWTALLRQIWVNIDRSHNLETLSFVRSSSKSVVLNTQGQIIPVKLSFLTKEIALRNDGGDFI